MGRTKQTSRKPAKAAPRVVTRYVAVRQRRPPPPKDDHIYNDCNECGKNLRKWGKDGSSGIICPNCMQQRIEKDIERRNKSKGRFGIFVPDSIRKPVVQVDMKTFDEARSISPYACQMRYNIRVCSTTYLPHYTCVMDDDDEETEKKHGPNARANEIANRMGVFDFEDMGTTLCGPILFLGPRETTLFPRELSFFTDLANEKDD